VVHYHRSGGAARRLAASFSAAGVRGVALHAALRTEQDCRGLVAAAFAEAGRLDILVNNAAVFHKRPLATTTEAGLLAELRTNLLVPVMLTRVFAERAERGQVVNLLDRRIRSNDTSCLAYLLSKKALAAFTEQAALELAPRIRVNGVAPGAILPPPGAGAERLRDRAGRVPLDRQVTPADVAQAVVALLKLDGVTGQILYVDGGQHLLGNAV
jgi:NAD(P)-dependent dehydrogenase (short-subunit alcohol dehydrogenase family)